MGLVNSKTLFNASGIVTSTSSEFDLSWASNYSMQIIATNTTPSAVVFASSAVNTSTEIITATAHGLTTGVVGQFTTSGALPTGLSLLTNYYIIVIDANSFQVASSYANATAVTPVPINLTAQGSGNDTFTATTLVGSLQLQKSNDKVNWTNEGASVAVTATATTWVEKADVAYIYSKMVYTHTSGVLTLLAYANAKD